VSICQHADRAVSTVLIHAVAMPVLEKLIYHATDDQPCDETEILIIIEGMRLAEVLVSLAEEHTSKTLFFKVSFLCLYLNDSFSSLPVDHCYLTPRLCSGTGEGRNPMKNQQMAINIKVRQKSIPSVL